MKILSHSYAVIPKSLSFFKTFIDKYLKIETDEETQYYYEETDKYWIVPRFFPEWIRKTYQTDSFVIDYKNIEPTEIEFQCSIKPRNKLQKLAIDYLSKPNQRFGILKAVPGFGKTIVTIKAIQMLGVKSLIIVPTNKIAKQWIEKITQFTDIKENQIPLFAGNLNTDSLMSMKIGIAITNTIANRYLKRDKEIHEIMYKAGIGSVFFDECHTTVPTPYFVKAQGILYSNRYFGLSATPFRETDDKTKLIYFNLGDNVFDISQYEIKPKIYEVFFTSQMPQKTKRWINWGNKFILQRYLQKVVECPVYTNLVTSLIKQAYDSKRCTLILASRKETLKLFGSMIKEKFHVDDIGFYWSGQSDDELKHKIIFATTQIFKEGVDVPYLDTLIILDQFANRTAIEQQIGRILRKFNDKKQPKVVFLVDREFEIQGFMSKKRQRIYNEIGFDYELINL